ncbi:glycosyltransferase [Phosphitispora fastidiosa]|uniref:glycosyltransferase n=1 Tax=Phosphitispora fastidiosa TaxID=2837202 RepID=UPI001E5D0476|nr:glycosyltransferase [Phosphitispora fastidiosa]MBU7008166.1 glycosyltransferase involved in cell wall biosynthesis [Phosphitispora fastidiosa]
MTSGEKKFDAIVCLSQIDWDFLWQRTQEIMSQFAAMGYPVLFVENTGVRIPNIKDAPRVWQRLKKIIRPAKGTNLSESHNNIKVLSPMALPFPYSRSAWKLNSALIRREIARFSRNTGVPVKRILLWSYMTTPLAVHLAESVSWAGVVVDLVSDPCKVPGAERIVPYHRKMLQKANVIFCASVPVVNNAKNHIGKSDHNKIKLFEDGFSTRLLDMVEKDKKRSALPDKTTVSDDKPFAAYIGGVNNKIWWDAVAVMARAFPDIRFIFAGPKLLTGFQRNAGQLHEADLPCDGAGRNVTWHPPFKEYQQLGSFLTGCCAGLIPYVPTPYVAEMRPAKINEYLVMGLPIVGTRMPELERLAVDHGSGIVYLADNVDEFAEKLREALDEDCENLREKRMQVACSRSWERVCSMIEDDLMMHLSK